MKSALCLFLFLPSLLLAASDWYRIEPGKQIALGECKFRLFTWNDGWKVSIASPKTVLPENGYPKMEKNGSFEYRGTYYLPQGKFQYEETLRVLEANRVQYRLELTSPVALNIDGTLLNCVISNRKWKERPILMDGTVHDFEPGKKQRSFRPVKEIRIPAKGGSILLRGNFQVNLVDISKSSYAPDSRQFRILPMPSSGMLRRILYDFDITYEPETARELDLHSAMNMGFQDDIAEDGRGGWTDQGASNDLRRMVPGIQTLDNVRFRIVDPEKNGGKGCIALRGKARLYFPVRASAMFPESVPGKWLYLLHATAWDAPKGADVGSVIVTSADGSSEVHLLRSKIHVANFWKPQPLESAAIGWRGDNDVAAIGLYVTRLPLKKSGIRGIEFRSAGSSVWMIVAASVSENPIPGITPRKFVVRAGGEWIPVKGSQWIRPGSILDFSAHLDAPAGKYGFARNENGRIVFERNRKPVRFYGANLCFDLNYMKEKKDIDFMADSFARIGYNFVRLHHFDRDLVFDRRGDGTELRADRLDRFDYTLAAFKKRGIYIALDLFINRNIRKNQIPSFPNGLDRSSYKALVWGDPDCAANFLKFSERLMTHVNPYTGVAWKEEPAIVNINLVNEDAVSWTTLSKHAKPVFEKHFAAFMNRNNYKTGPFEKDRYWKLFLSSFYPERYRNLTDALRKMGVRQMLCDQNHSNDVLSMLTREPYDLVENHTYWCHPAFLKQSWGGPALVQNISAIPKFGGAIASMFQTRAIGKPFSLTEWDFVNPNRYNAEGAFLTGAYASLQDWSALCRFSYGGKELGDRQGILGFFDIANDPLRLLSERAGILFFTRRDVKPSDIRIPLLLDRSYFADKDPRAEGVVPSRIGLIAGTGNLIFSSGQPITFPAGVKAAIVLNQTGRRAAGMLPTVDSADHLNAIPHLERKGILPRGSELFEEKRYRSSTGELLLDGKNTTFQVLTSRSEGFLLEKGRSLPGKFAQVRNLKNFCAVLVAAMDGQPLNGSERFLLLHLTDSKNSEMVFGDKEMQIVEDFGKLPILVRKGVAELTIRRRLEGFTLYPVRNDGTRLSPLPMRMENGHTVILLDTALALAYELVKEPSGKR